MSLSETTNGQRKAVTDAQLREELKHRKPAEIAKKYGITRQAVYKRVKQLNLTTVSAVVAPHESRRFVNHNLDALQQLTKTLDRVNRLFDACHEWLLDPHNPEKYDLSPRSSEVDVHYEVEITTDKGFRVEKRKKVFSELCSNIEDGCDTDGARFVRVVKGEYKIADTRDLILKTAQESRHIVVAAADIARMLSDMKAMQMFREALLHEISKVSPEVASNIAEAVRRSIVLQGSLDGLNALSAPANNSD